MIGTTATQQENNFKPERSGKRFVISKVQTNAIACVEIDDKNRIIDNRLFWLWYPKKSSFIEYKEKEFKIFNEYNKQLDFEYIIESGGALK